MTTIHWKNRLQATAIHLVLSLIVAAFAAAVVFGLWYPSPYPAISGGRELFTLLVTVDVIVGPLITLMIFNRAKPRVELRRDLAIVGALQACALAYGMWAVAMARPVFLTFEIDRFRVVHAIEVPPDFLPQAPVALRTLPWAGPVPLAVRPFRSPQEMSEATLAALDGVSLASRPDLWESYDTARTRVLAAAKPVTQLRNRSPEWASQIDAELQLQGRLADTTMYLPMVGRKTFWTVLLDPISAQVVGFLPIDSF